MCFLALTALAGKAPVGEQRLGLGDLRNLPIGTEVTMGYNATVLYVDYKVIFLEDETGYAAINVDRVSFNDGDVITLLFLKQKRYRAFNGQMKCISPMSRK